MASPRPHPAPFAQNLRKIQRWANDHRRWLTIALILLAALAVAARAGLGLSRTTQLTGIEPLSGHSYVAELKAPKFPWNRMLSSRGDTNERPTASQLQLFEDGKLLPQPHALHAAIAEKGAGQYSHYAGSVIFAASDSSNPVTNRRVYTANYRLHLRGWLFAAVLLFSALSLVLLYLTEIKRLGARSAAESPPAPATSGEVGKTGPVKMAAFSLLSIAILSLTGLGLIVAFDMFLRVIYSPRDSGIGTDTSFFEYRDYFVTTQPANLVLGNSKHAAERYFPDKNCANPDGTTARFNSLGFRSPEFSALPPKQANEIRIIATGGSASMSLNVSEACTLAANLERLLAQQAPGKVYRIFTLGSGAWKSFQELIVLQRYQNDIKPDLIVVFDGFNDITHTFLSDASQAYGGWWNAEAYDRLRSWVWGGPLATLQGIRFVRDFREWWGGLSFNLAGRANSASRFPDLATPGNMATRFELPVDRQRIAQRTDFDPRNRNIVDQYLRNSRLMDLVAQDSGIPILHVLQPMLYLKDPMSAAERERLAVYEEMVNYSIQGYLRMSSGLEELTRGSKVARYLDLSAPFQGDAANYFNDYCHMNPAGYRIVSARIADVVAEMLARPK